MNRAILAAALLAVLTGCSSLPRTPVTNKLLSVEAEGWAPIDPRDPAGTRGRALAEAQKHAVEQAAGVEVRATTQVEAAIAVRQRITASVRGRVRRFEMLREKEEDGFHKTRIRAWVVLRRNAEEDAAMEPPPGNPKVAVTILAKGGRSVAQENGAEAAVRQKLLAGGFSAADSAPQADILVRGDVETRPVSDERLGGFSSSRAKITLQALDSSNKQVVWEKTLEASALAVDEPGAEDQAVQNAGGLIGEAAAKDLSAYLWNR